MHPEDNARGRRLDPPDSSSSVPLILRWMARSSASQAIRWPRGLGRPTGLDARGETAWGLAADQLYIFVQQRLLSIELSGVRAEKGDCSTATGAIREFALYHQRNLTLGLAR